MTVPPSCPPSAAAVVVPCLSSVVAGYGERPFPTKASGVGRSQQAPEGPSFSPTGSPGQKGTVMGTLRSLGALARALGPMVAASGEAVGHVMCPGEPGLGGCWALKGASLSCLLRSGHLTP